MPSSTAAKREPIVPLPENRSALRAIRRLKRHVAAGKAFPPVFLYGSPGTGKSHLASALQDELSVATDCTVQVVAAIDLGRLLQIPLETSEDRRAHVRACDLLIVEDVQHFPAAAADAFARLIDFRQARSRCLLATGSTGPAALRHLPRRLASRLASGIIVGLESLSRQSRKALARNLCEQRGLQLVDEVIDWLVRDVTGGARPILGKISRLETLSRSVPHPLTLADIREQLPEDVEHLSSPIERVARHVSDWFGVTVRQLQSKARHRAVLWPRQVGMYLARRVTDLSLMRIGEFFGDRDHATVLHACRKVEEVQGGDPALTKRLRQLEVELR